MRILGLDYGEKRIGVALCDELGLTAQALTTVIRKSWRNDVGIIASLVRTYDVEKIVIGYPLRLDGTEGIQCEKVVRFARRLEAALGIPVIRWDETLTTKEAEEILSRSGVPPRKRRGVVDRLAASLILQSYLDAISQEKIPSDACDANES
ncbi:Holliday junction resolvase RuvX [Syntrophus aciditrophicus]|uniref:Putative pre-16S rRNA nuclease n=1 Tax=Syntrophus aciditrophicus (strain SB) TaxID=56780 RepID=YQGF_SYNAS|nr:Holliday junction resolvase RuvX [Syntrophus aciditrophicus]Q2LR42.1 RecName: Full=Putative pre-16S rRNA nuclease [Syntrophus aciditrophicus SB]ABC76548.1 4-amino-4-deoxychorismate lyase [Syntrophus aciditrophicus SB]OPY18346.1 MAG: putative Holliday junction resolvase [Syntrophus sp. PtaB.Bin075]